MEHKRLLARIAQQIDGFLYRYASWNLAQAVARTRRWLLPFLGLRVSIYKLQTREANAEPDLVTLCVGGERQMQHIIDLLYSEEPARKHVANVFLWSLPRVLASLSPHADLIVARTDGVSGALLFSERYFTIPEWVAFRLILSELPIDLAQISSSIKSDWRRVWKHGFSPVVSHEGGDLEMFYRTMYVPYIARRHGSSAIFRSFGQLEQYSKRGELLFVEWKGQYVAGGVYTLDGGVAHFLWLGVKDGDFDYVRAGALAALYCFIISRARELGCEQVDFGGVRPFFDDGIFWHKRKWGMAIEQHPLAFYDLKLRVCNLAPQVRSVLVNHPFIFRDGTDLSGLVLINGEKTKDGDGYLPVRFDEVWRLYKDCWTAGLYKLYVLSPQGFGEEADQVGWTALMPGIVLISGGTARSRPRVVGTRSDAVPKAVFSLIQGHPYPQSS